MIVPYYFELSDEQLASLQAAPDEDTATDIVFEWLEEEDDTEVEDYIEFDKAPHFAAEYFTEHDPSLIPAIYGVTTIVEDPPVIISTAQEVADFAEKLAVVAPTIDDDDVVEVVTGLADFYSKAAAAGHAVCIVCN
ncbi:MAG: DUF1877 family protein [Corynebacterium sp.]|uniref:DUF1877 family protein n=1 Tax=Corynebacterium sp. TaxID=1720 RepID=UPI0026DDC922|nr:DUF1877 family protein [Corynebacterium sp.]MDO5099615.1 DUF1877 family protein [Corynebacterium sp.]